MPENHDRPELWIPDNPDGSGWANVDWARGDHTRGSNRRRGTQNVPKS